MAVGGKARVGPILIDSENDRITVGPVTIQGIPSEKLRVVLTSMFSQTGFAADATGVVADSPVALFSPKLVKKLRLLSEVTSIPSDCTVRIGVYNYDAAAYVFYRDYAGATGRNIDEYTGTMPSEDERIVIRVEVTVASATAGATADTGPCCLQAEIAP